MIAGFRCAVCGAMVDIAALDPWCCPNATSLDRHHVLRLVEHEPSPEPAPVIASVIDDPNPLVRYAPRSAWFAFARARGMTEDAAVTLALELDAAVVSSAGAGFSVTPFEPHPSLAAAVSEVPFRLLVKDETGQVSGSHKVRHLASILLHLLAAEALGLRGGVRPILAIASCGNAALAAAVLAHAVEWPLRVFVPPWADPAIIERLDQLGADIVTCARVAGDPPGDPCLHRFRETVAAGALPFSVQGPENALCLDGGRSIAWEMAEQCGDAGIDRVIVQVGGGALATCVADGWIGAGGDRPALYAVEAEGCAPLARAWLRAREIGLDRAAAQWSACMWPWESEPSSVADGILDDETYDWLGVTAGLAATDGDAVVASESLIVAAHRLALERTSIDVSATGSAGLAGLLALAPQLVRAETVAILFTGQSRH